MSGKSKTKKVGCGGCLLWFFAAIGVITVGPFLIVVISLILRTFILEIRWQPSGSMEPTIHGSPNKRKADKLIIDKTAYRFKNPQRGDIISFFPTEELKKQQYQDAFTKRIVGMPGEKIELNLGEVYINNQPLKEDYLSPQTKTVIDVCTASPDNIYLEKPQTIPPNSYLVLGDNRNSSYDSRCWGTVPRGNIIGKVSQILKN